MTDNDNIIKEEYEKNGYIVCKNVFTEQELDNCKAEILTYVKENRNKVLKKGGGISIPDFINRHSSLVQTIQLKENKKFMKHCKFYLVALIIVFAVIMILELIVL